MRRRARGLATLVVTALVGAASLTACDPLLDMVVTSPGMFPVFQEGVSDYVNRCDPTKPTRIEVKAPSGTIVSVAGQPSKRGTFTATFTQKHNERMTIVVTRSTGSKSYHVRCLPAGFPEFRAEGDGTTPQAEFYVTTLINGFGPTNRAVIFDNHGVPIWWSEPRFAFLTTPLPTGDLATLGIEGGMDVEGLDGVTTRALDTVGAPSDFHDVLLLDNGNDVMVTADYRECDLSTWGREDAECLFHEIQEIDPAGEVVWSWKAEDHIPISETPPRWRGEFDPVRNSVDPWHWNAIEWTGDGFLISLRHQDAIYKIDYATGEIDWKLGGTPTADSLAVIGDRYFDRGSSISGQHDVRLQPDGTITLYDNRTNSFAGKQPRAVRYRIDEAAGTATLVRQVEDRIAPISPCCGSTRVLPGGNYVTGWGGGPWFTENRPDGSQVFRLLGVFVYRVIPLAPGEMSRDDIRRGMDLQWNGTNLAPGAQPPVTTSSRGRAPLGDPEFRLGLTAQPEEG